jgi:transcriptional regulator with XRE-family HTH domain
VKVTQEQLAETAGIDPRYLQKIESGKVNPSLETIGKLKSAFGCDWEDLLRGIG